MKMNVEIETKYEVKYGGKVSRFEDRELALSYFDEKASENKRPILYKITKRTEVEKFSIGDLANEHR
jgi:hypothetical protein